jgi:uncharacterized caspase-like protein
LILFAALALPAAAQAKCDDPRESKRVALVIGNGTFLPGQWARLPNAESDAQAVCDGFAALGFRVIKVEDADRDAMDAAIREFAALSPNSDVALFYFAGHGFEYAGINWLVPTDAPVETARGWLKDQFVDLATVLNAVKQSKHGLVFLDACRTRDAVVRIKDADPNGVDGPAGTINLPGDFDGVIFYSTARGASAFDAAPATSKNSPFAQAVVERLSLPDLELRDYFDFVRGDVKRRTAAIQGGPQSPTPYGTLGARLYFNQPPPPPAAEIRDSNADARAAAEAAALRMVMESKQAQRTESSSARARAEAEARAARDRGGFPVAGLPGAAYSSRPEAGHNSAVPSLTRKFEGLDPGKAKNVLATLDKETLAKEDEPQIIARVLGQADAGSLGVLAESGDATAQYLYGAMLYLGLGIEKDLPAARAMLARSASTGSAAGMLEYGYFLENFGDRPGDQQAARELYEKAAATGYGKAQAHLAYRLWNAQPPEKDMDRALALWRAAADQGYPYAIYAAGVYGGRMDEARTKLTDLANKGNRAGDAWLCELAEYEGTTPSAFDHCLKAAQDGFPGSMALTAQLYQEGLGVARSSREALYWARLALDQPDFDDPNRRPEIEAMVRAR